MSLTRTFHRFALKTAAAAFVAMFSISAATQALAQVPDAGLQIGPDQVFAGPCEAINCVVRWDSGGVDTTGLTVVTSMNVGVDLVSVKSKVPYTITDGVITFDQGAMLAKKKGKAVVRFRVPHDMPQGTEVVSTAVLTDDLGRSSEEQTLLTVRGQGNDRCACDGFNARGARVAAGIGPSIKVGPDLQFGAPCEVINCKIGWKAGCFDMTGVEVFALTTPDVEVLGVKSSTPFTPNNPGMTFDVGTLGGKRKGQAVVKFRVPHDAVDGEVVTSTATLTDDAGNVATSETSFVVRAQARDRCVGSAAPPQLAVGPDQHFARRGDTVLCTINWMGPGSNVTGAQVVTTADPSIEVVSMEADVPFTVDGDTATFQVGALSAKQKGGARIVFRVKDDIALGTVVTSAAAYSDDAGYTLTSATSFTVRGNDQDNPEERLLTLRLKGTKTVPNGGNVKFDAIYSEASEGNALVVTLPEELSAVAVVPAATTTVGNDITWENLPAGAGEVTVRALVTLPNGLDEANLSIDGVMTDDRGMEAFASGSIIVQPPATGANGLAMTAKSKGGFVPGKRNTIRFEYRNLVGTGSLTAELPEGLTVVGLSPAATTVDGGTLTWSDLRKKRGSVTVETVIGDTVSSGDVLSVSGSLTDDRATAIVDVEIPIR